MFFLIAIVLSFITVSNAETQCLLVSLPFPTENSDYEKFVQLNVSINSVENSELTSQQEQLQQLTAQVNDTLEVVLFNSNFEYSTLLRFISCKFSKNRVGLCDSMEKILFCSKVTGVIGNLDFKTAKIIEFLAFKTNHSIVQVAAVPPLNSLPVRQPLNSIVDMNPLSHHIECLVNFIKRLNWTRLALIVENANYYKYEAELLQKELLLISGEIIISPFIIVSNTNSHKYVPWQVKQFGTNIAIVLASEITARSIVREALEFDLMWPSYAWILHTSAETIIDINIMEGVIIVDHYSVKGNQVTPEVFEEICEYNMNTSMGHKQHNIDCNFRDVLYDSILAATLVNRFKQFGLRFTGLRKKIELDMMGRRLKNITLVQIYNHLEAEIGYYDSKSEDLVLHEEFFSSRRIPKGMTLMTDGRTSTAHTIIILISFAACFIFLSIVLILFIYFRNAPEVKAASITLSMCMFLGCFILLMFIPLLLLEAQPNSSYVPLPTHFNLCMCLAWFSGIGLPIPIILATILLKMLRVYVIFIHPHSYKRKLFSDKAIFIYLLIILAPNVLILILWSAIDPLLNRVLQTEHQNFIEIREKCSSEHIFIWPILLITYLSILIIIVIIITFKTSKIRFKIFRDTKATNAFAFVTIFVTVMTLTYWYFFRSLEPTIEISRSSLYSLYAGHFIITISCPCFLFIPKIYPSISKYRKK